LIDLARSQSTEERYAISKFTLTALDQPASAPIDPLTELLRSGARQLIAQAVEVELQTLLDQHAGKRLTDGRQAVVRNGHLPKRTVKYCGRQAFHEKVS
tara:strand:+ start:240 stop:536 length:297 start_codon:yes stop_codon:yes gene_type:complete